MAIKIELINNALVMHDTVTSEVIGESPKNLVYYNVDRLDNEDIIEIVNIDVQNNVQKTWQAQPVGANTIDTGDAAYTVASFKTFARTNLGF